MSISQLSVFVENKAGHLADALATLADGRVNVLAFTIADTTDYGILRLVVDEQERAKDLLSTAQCVEECLRQELGIRPRVRLVEPKTIPRYSGKAQRVIDNRVITPSRI